MNDLIRNKTISFLNNCKNRDSKALSSSIIKLNEEWEIERVLETNAAPPLPILRKLGVRTTQEIEKEKIALKFLRGDFIHKVDSIHHLLSNIEKQ